MDLVRRLAVCEHNYAISLLILRDKILNLNYMLASVVQSLGEIRDWKGRRKYRR